MALVNIVEEKGDNFVLQTGELISSIKFDLIDAIPKHLNDDIKKYTDSEETFYFLKNARCLKVYRKFT